MVSNTRVVLVSLLALVITVISHPAKAQTPQQTLNQYVADLQKNPGDYALRERIIKHVQTMRPVPAIPLEAEKFEGRAEFAIKNAKTEADFLDAAKEYEKALLIAPWVPVYYFNQGITFEKAGKLKEAKQSFEFYLLAAPNAQDAREVRKRIAGIEYAIEKAARESSPQAVAAKKQQEEKDFSKKLDGVRYKYHFSSNRDTGDWTIDIRGNRVIQGYILGRNVYGEPNGVWKQWQETTLSGREFDIRGNCMVAGDMVARVFKGKISEDGYTVLLEDCYGTNTYRRER